MNIPAIWLKLFFTAKKISISCNRTLHKLAQLATRNKLKIALALVLIWFMSILPLDLFDLPNSIIVLDDHEELIGAHIASDGQWRFPLIDSIPIKFKESLLAFEDKRFNWHPGVDPVSMTRAIFQNLKAGKIVSGGSTLTMQTIRLMRKNQVRSIYEKLWEAVLAVRLELRYSKKTILRLYATHAPFGGNTVGLETASWRYYHKKPSQLTWAESATLAVLPNDPSNIFPGKGRDLLLKKRNRVLKLLLEKGKIDKDNYNLSLQEPLPDKPGALPNLVPHFMNFMNRNSQMKGTKVLTNIDSKLQQKINELVIDEANVLQGNGINNVAILVLDTKTNQIVSYTGNVPMDPGSLERGVDMIQQPRSVGSLLKPLLYAKAMDVGLIAPNSFLIDIPTTFGDYKPENFRRTNDGLANTRSALARSLNIPFVRLLEQYGIQSFHADLKQMGFGNLNPEASHYGLTMIVGGVEASLWDMCKAYSGLARTVLNYPQLNGAYNEEEYHEPIIQKLIPSKTKKTRKNAPVVSAGSAWCALDAMQELERPDESGQWEKFTSAKKIAWKTGTSFGYKDAWAIGVTSRYTVGVWVGNCTGEGRPNLIGVYTAAPILFKIFDQLSQSTWFPQPFDDMKNISICKESGYRAGSICPIDSSWIPKNSLRSPVCIYHKNISLTRDHKYQVFQGCHPYDDIEMVPWLVIPPVEAFYYAFLHPEYKSLPPIKPGCEDDTQRGITVMRNVYPTDKTIITIPRLADGKREAVVFKAFHTESNAKLMWYIDENFEGTTIDKHEINLLPGTGDHLLTLVDGKGRRLVSRFSIRFLK